jgi:hypothetical protein
MTIVYIVGRNIPGYMPDSDPVTFPDLRSAKHCLIADMEAAMDENPEHPGIPYFTAISEIEKTTDTYTSATMPNGLVYWINTDSVDDRVVALAEYLGCSLDELDESKYSENSWEHGRREYLVLTESEADEMAWDCILDSVWAFNADFLIGHMELPYDAIPMIESFSRNKCESANDTFLAMIKDKDSFVRDAISADGRGHFINTYDGEENEEGEYLIYRMS